MRTLIFVAVVLAFVALSQGKKNKCKKLAKKFEGCLAKGYEPKKQKNCVFVEGKSLKKRVARKCAKAEKNLTKKCDYACKEIDVEVCKPGSYRVNDDCVSCAQNTFSEIDDAAECTECPPGTSAAPESSSANDCKKVSGADCAKCADDAYKRGESKAEAGCWNCGCLDGTRMCGCAYCTNEAAPLPDDQQACPWSHPNVYYNGEYCCKFSQEKVYTPQGELCDGGPIGFTSMCCKDNGYTKCTEPPCSDYIPTDDQQACPSSHPNVYYNGEYCCKFSQEKVYTPQGELCDGGPIGLTSMCCKDDGYTKCTEPPCSDF